MVGLTMFHDPGHGWLRVVKGDLKHFGISEKVSTYSYQDDKGFAYLEEDCDAALFITALKEADREIMIIHDSVDDDSFIRELPRYTVW